MRRTAASPPPCAYDRPDSMERACPKGSPAEEAEHVLSDDNWLTWQLYRQVRATGGACLTEQMRSDPLLMQNLAYIDELAKARERQEFSRQVAANLAPILFRP